MLLPFVRYWDGVSCAKDKSSSGHQIMSELPTERVSDGHPPFCFAGVDYFGPLFVKQGRSHVKRYGCLFTCSTVRAVHIEIVHSLTDSFIDAL